MLQNGRKKLKSRTNINIRTLIKLRAYKGNLLLTHS